MKNLAIDIGNTRTKLAIFRNEEMVLKEVWEKLSLPDLQELAYNQKIENAILSSTAEVPVKPESFLKDNFPYIRLDHGTSLPITICYKTPETLGRDRIAAVAGARALFPEENVLVIDAGTCIKMDMLSETGQFLGGNISPGIQMRLEAMHHFTAKLPVANRKGVVIAEELLGDSTDAALRNGGELGAFLEVTAFIEKCRRRFKPLKVVFTGGDADFFVKNIKTKIFANSNLVLIGLNQILQHNVRNFRQEKSGL